MCSDGSLVGGRKRSEAFPSKESQLHTLLKAEKLWMLLFLLREGQPCKSAVATGRAGRWNRQGQAKVSVLTPRGCCSERYQLTLVTVGLLLFLKLQSVVTKPEGISSPMPISCPGC